MKITCHECVRSELEIIDLHDDGSEILVKPCKECAKEQYDNGYNDGRNDCGCSEEDYQEGYNEAEAYYQEKIDILNKEIAELKKELDND